MINNTHMHIHAYEAAALGLHLGCTWTLLGLRSCD